MNPEAQVFVARKELELATADYVKALANLKETITKAIDQYSITAAKFEQASRRVAELLNENK